VKVEGAVVDASPLIVLCRAGLIDLLPRLFPEILVPGTVWAEIGAGAASDPAARQIPAAAWAKRAEVAAIPPDLATWNLGAGESEVLTLARERPGCRAMVDDAAARACARTFAIPILGTGGALVLAKRRGLIPSVGAALGALRDAGLWLSGDIERLLLQQAGE
jgi:predicted nucleic acid-binding protein